MVTVFPAIVAGPEVTVKVIGSPEEAVAEIVKGATPYISFARAPNVIV
jgi:hypothetical protein